MNSANGHANQDVTFANLLPPIFMSVVMATIWSVHMCLHVLPMLQIGIPWRLVDPVLQAQGYRECVLSQVFVGLLLICFIRALLTSPGSVPNEPEWLMKRGDGTNGDKSDPISANTREFKLTGERRNCKWCLKYKPDRCHHCRICRTCILKMDHHCPWIMNCVGWANHKYFFLLVIYSVLSCLFIGSTIIESVRVSLVVEMHQMNRFFLVLCLMLTVIMGTLMSVFLLFHTWLMLHGMTTIEYCEKSTSDRAGKVPSYSPYNLGNHFENIKQVLGPRPYLWILPLDPPLGDGINHKVSVSPLYLPKASTMM